MRPDRSGRRAQVHERSLTSGPRPHPCLILSRPHGTVDTSSWSTLAADGSWPKASTCGGPIMAEGGDSERGLYEWHVGVGSEAEPAGAECASDLQELLGKNFANFGLFINFRHQINLTF